MPSTPQKKPEEIEFFQDVVVVPYEVILQRTSSSPLEHKGGPILPDWDNQVASRFCRAGKPVDTLPDQPEMVTRRIDGPAVWCDPCYGHFGHQINDFGARILQGVTEFPDARFLFAPTLESGIKTLDDTPAFFRAMLEWYGVPAAQVTMVTEPTRVSELHIPPQAEQLFSTGPSTEYLDLLDRVVERNLGKMEKSGTVYVSRAAQPYCLAGESYLETLFQSVGIRVIRPEKLSLKEQLRCYYETDHLIFSEGSAVHGMQLLGRSLSKVSVLVRRFGKRIIEPHLQDRVEDLEYIDVVKGLIYGLRFNGRERLHQSMTVLDETKLLDYLGAIDWRMAERWDRKCYLEAQDQEIYRWIEVESKNTASNAPGSKATVIQRLRDLNFEHMIPYAQEHFAYYATE